MLDKEILDLLVCPQDQLPLQPADEALIAELNEAIDAGQIENQAGRLIDGRVQGGLICKEHGVLYPIIEDIPVLLADEAIALEQIHER